MDVKIRYMYVFGSHIRCCVLILAKILCHMLAYGQTLIWFTLFWLVTPFWHYNIWGHWRHFFFGISFLILYFKYREAIEYLCSEYLWTLRLVSIHIAGNQYWAISQAMDYEKQYFDLIHTSALNPASHKIVLSKGNSFKAHSVISGYICSQAEFVHCHLWKVSPDACIAPASHKWKGVSYPFYLWHIYIGKIYGECSSTHFCWVHISFILSIYWCSKLTLSYHPELIYTITNLQYFFVLIWCFSCSSCWPLYPFRGHGMSPDLGKMSVTDANRHIFCCHTENQSIINQSIHFHWKCV